MTAPLDYGTPGSTTAARRRWFAVDVFCFAGTIALPAALLGVLVIPKVELIFTDFGVKLPAVSQAVFATVRRLGPRGVLGAALLACVLLGCFAPLLDASPDAGPEAIARRKRLTRRAVLWLGTLLLVGLVVSIALPYTALLTGLTAGGGK